MCCQTVLSDFEPYFFSPPRHVSWGKGPPKTPAAAPHFELCTPKTRRHPPPKGGETTPISIRGASLLGFRGGVGEKGVGVGKEHAQSSPPFLEAKQSKAGGEGMH